MPANTKIIKRRIQSIGNTKKITKAMELVAASKMRRAVNSVLATRPYSNLGWETVAELANKTDQRLHPLLRVSDEVRKILVISIASDRGLCAGFNAQLGKKVVGFVGEHPKVEVRDFVTVGKKITDLAKTLQWNIVATFTQLSNNPSILDIRPVAQLVIDDFVAEKYDKVYLAYTDFESSIKQIPHVHQLLPITKARLLGEVGVIKEKEKAEHKYSYEYKFEPTPQEVLDMMLPRLVEVQIYQAILESSASEHAARMVAMKNASDAASDMIDDLTFTFNQARQATITREISEISAGKAAIE